MSLSGIPGHKIQHDTHLERLVARLALPAAFLTSQNRFPGSRPEYVANATDKENALRHVRIFDAWRFGEPSTMVIDGNSIAFDARTVQVVLDGEWRGFLLPGLLVRLDSLEILATYSVTTAVNIGCSNYALCSAFREQVRLA